MISLCRSCWCMTNTIDGRCAKCGKEKINKPIGHMAEIAIKLIEEAFEREEERRQQNENN